MSARADDFRRKFSTRLRRHWCRRPDQPLLRAIVEQGYKLTFDRESTAYTMIDLNLIAEEPERFELLRDKLNGWWDAQYNLTRLEQSARRAGDRPPRRATEITGEYIGPAK